MQSMKCKVECNVRGFIFVNDVMRFTSSKMFALVMDLLNHKQCHLELEELKNL